MIGEDDIDKGIITELDKEYGIFLGDAIVNWANGTDTPDASGRFLDRRSILADKLDQLMGDPNNRHNRQKGIKALLRAIELKVEKS